MILGIGLDVVKVERLRAWTRQPGMLERFFHEAEIEKCLAAGEGGLLSLAARFAAKEAFGKALGSGLSGFALREVQVVNDGAGKPDIVLHGGARRRFEQAGGRTLFLSLTHEDDYALAMVVMEG
jgi:holo-[acyl-carrier protein] synthase